MEGFWFQFVCSGCLTVRGVLESPELPDECPECGLHDPWTGPIARTRFQREFVDTLAESPFYLGAQHSAARVIRFG